MEISEKLKVICGLCCSKGSLDDEDKLEFTVPVSRPRGGDSIHMPSDLFNFKSPVVTHASFKESILEVIPELAN